MSGHTNVQIIEQNGKPAFAVIPYDEYLKLVPEEETIPHEVGRACHQKGAQPCKSMAYPPGAYPKRSGRTGWYQPVRTFADGKGGKQPFRRLLINWQKAMGISVSQLTD